MGQSTRLYTRIVFCGKTYNHKSEVEEDLESIKERRNRAIRELTILSFMTEPNKICGEESPEFYIKDRLEESVGEIEECAVEQSKLEILLDRWEECHTKDGLGKYPPEGEQHTYIDGTFVLTDKYPTKEALLA